MLDLGEYEEEIHENDVIVTSSLGGVFPENLLVGKVQSVIRRGSDPFQKATVEPFFNIKKANLLFILTGY